MTMTVRPATALILILTLGFSAVPAAAGPNDDWRALKAEAKRASIDEMADEALDRVLAEQAKAATLLESSFGWAVFDNLKIAIGFSGGGGNGVAVERASGKRTYMKMGTAGVGLGLGGQSYQVVFFFQDEATFRRFVDKGWKADASAQAAAGTEGVNATTGFVNGIAVWQITGKGLMASADIAGTKYWKNKKLN
ncbi:MAG: YSC84-related protein [Thermoanaerobaculales bacterium]|jgi:lipid-binding SYLF domain-containing protein|nr:YSC84-related protein [Thermoanaerobaculales bacterium]